VTSLEAEQLTTEGFVIVVHCQVLTVFYTNGIRAIEYEKMRLKLHKTFTLSSDLTFNKDKAKQSSEIKVFKVIFNICLKRIRNLIDHFNRAIRTRVSHDVDTWT
jgi:hypothetical protein